MIRQVVSGYKVVRRAAVNLGVLCRDEVVGGVGLFVVCYGSMLWSRSCIFVW